jgi:hypothetical protein
MLKPFLTVVAFTLGGIAAAVAVTIQTNPRAFTSTSAPVLAHAALGGSVSLATRVQIDEVWVYGEIVQPPALKSPASSARKPAPRAARQASRARASLASSGAHGGMAAPSAAPELAPCSGWNSLGPKSVEGVDDASERNVRPLCAPAAAASPSS